MLASETVRGTWVVAYRELLRYVTERAPALEAGVAGCPYSRKSGFFQSSGACKAAGGSRRET